MKRMIGVLLAALALDAGTKWLASELLAGRTVALGWLVELRLTRNDGMALGLFAGNRAAGMLLPLAVIFCGWLLLRRYRLTPFTQTACGLVLGGFLGNFGERLLFGSVVDMLYFPWLPWFICNVADIAICFGVAMLVISTLLRPQDWRERRENDSAAGGN